MKQYPEVKAVSIPNAGPDSRPVTSSATSESGVQVIARAAQILRALGESAQPMTLSDLARRLELPRSTIHRLITALEAENLVGRVGERDGYRPGMGLLPLGQSARRWLGQELRPKLLTLSRQLNETVDLAVLEGDKVVFVEQVVAQNRLQVVSGVGMGFPLYCTANGKALLADLPEEQVAAHLPGRLSAFTPTTLTSRDALYRELDDIRESGVAFDREEYTPGICAAGVVIHDALRGTLALSVPVPAQRFYGQEEVIAETLRVAVRGMFSGDGQTNELKPTPAGRRRRVTGG